jgi:hypothetical protein
MDYYLVARFVIGGVVVNVFYDPSVFYAFWDEIYISQGLDDVFGANPALGAMVQDSYPFGLALFLTADGTPPQDAPPATYGELTLPWPFDADDNRKFRAGAAGKTTRNYVALRQSSIAPEASPHPGRSQQAENGAKILVLA